MKVLRKFKEKKTIKDTAIVLGSNLFSQTISFLVVLFVSRGLSVAEYGTYAILNNISMFVSDLADMGMNGGITRFVAEYRAKQDYKSEQQLVIYALKRKLINWIIILCTVVLGAKLIAGYLLHDVDKYKYLYIIAIISGFSLLIGGMRAILQGRQEFYKNSISIIVWCVIWFLGILIFMIIDRLSIGSSLIAQTFSGFICVIFSFKLLDFRLHDIKLEITIESEIKSKFNSYGNWMMLWSLFAILQSKIDVFMLATLTTSDQVSYYDIATKITRPILMVISAYAQVLNPKFATFLNKKDLSNEVRKISKIIMMASMAIVFGIFLIKPVITFVFGIKYVCAVIPCQLLFVAIVFFIWTVPFNSALYALNMPYVFTIAAAIGLVVTVIGNYFLLGRFGAVGAAWTYIAAQSVGLLVAVVAYFNSEKRN